MAPGRPGLQHHHRGHGEFHTHSGHHPRQAAMKKAHTSLGNAFIVFFLAGCSILPIADEDIGWQFSSLSGQGCPNLSGRYMNDGMLFLLLTGGVRSPYQGVSVKDIEELRGLPRNSVAPSTIYQTAIKQRADQLNLTLTDSSNVVYATAKVPTNLTHIGCYQGALVIHKVSVHGAEGSEGSVHYTELLVRPESNRAISVVSQYATRNLSRVSGRAVGPELDRSMKHWIFRRAD